MLEGLHGEESMAELCCREGIAASQYYSWSQHFQEAGKRRMADDTKRQANSHIKYQIRVSTRQQDFPPAFGFAADPVPYVIQSAEEMLIRLSCQ